jgi:hypothetical protein
MTIKTIDYLGFKDLLGLQRGDFSAIRVPNFYPDSLSGEIADRMSQSSLLGQYANAPLIGRVGQAYFECLTSEDHRITYEQNAVNWINQMRISIEPYLSPIDKLRLTLDELWPAGSKLAVLNGKKMFVGLARVFGPGANAEPHQDILSWDAPDASEAQDLDTQFAANIYLRMPESGGELVVWPKSLSRTKYQEYQIEGSYGIEEDKIGSEPIRITPKIGELVLFNSSMVHSVNSSEVGDRVTWSCFIGIRGSDKTLTVWS